MDNCEGSWQSVELPGTLDEETFLNILLVCGRSLQLSRATTDTNDRTIQVYFEAPETLIHIKAILDQAVADALLRQQIRVRSSNNIDELVDAVLKRAYALQ